MNTRNSFREQKAKRFKMFEEIDYNISDQRLLAMESQKKRLSQLPVRCPSGLHVAINISELPCFSRSSDPFWCYCHGEVLWMTPVYFDEGEKK